MKRSEIVILAFAGLILAFGFSFVATNPQVQKSVLSKQI